MGYKQGIDEHVMVIPNKLLLDAGSFQGISFDIHKFIGLIEDPKATIFRKRQDVENDPQYKQIIPYAIFRHHFSVFSYRRGKLLSEKRLLGNYSIGIGGHISLYDENLFTETYEHGIEREISEEIVIGSKYEKSIVAFINDDTNEVGRVHFGVVYLFTLEKPMVKPKEKSINDPKFLTIPDLKKNIIKFENWSQICIRNINDIIVE